MRNSRLFCNILTFMAADVILCCAPPLPSSILPQYVHDYNYNNYHTYEQNDHYKSVQPSVIVNGVPNGQYPLNDDDIETENEILQSALTQSNEQAMGVPIIENYEYPLVNHLKMNKISSNSESLSSYPPGQFSSSEEQIHSHESQQSVQHSSMNQLKQINEIFDELKNSLNSDTVTLVPYIGTTNVIDQTNTVDKNHDPEVTTNNLTVVPQEMFTPISDEAQLLTPANGNAHLLVPGLVGLYPNPLSNTIKAMQERMKAIRYKNVDASEETPPLSMMNIDRFDEELKLKSGLNQQFAGNDETECDQLHTTRELVQCLQMGREPFIGGAYNISQSFSCFADDDINDRDCNFKSSPSETVQFFNAKFNDAVESDRNFHVRVHQFAALASRLPFTPMPAGNFLVAVFHQNSTMVEMCAEQQTATLRADVANQNGDGRLTFDYWTTLKNYTLKVCTRLPFEKQCTSDIEFVADDPNVEIGIVNPLPLNRNGFFLVEIVIVNNGNCAIGDDLPDIFMLDNIKYQANFYQPHMDNVISSTKIRKFFDGKQTRIITRGNKFEERQKLLHRYKVARIRHSPQKFRGNGETGQAISKISANRNGLKEFEELLLYACSRLISENLQNNCTAQRDSDIQVDGRLTDDLGLTEVQNLKKFSNSSSDKSLSNRPYLAETLKFSPDSVSKKIRALRELSNHVKPTISAEGMALARFVQLNQSSLSQIGIQPLISESIYADTDKARMPCTVNCGYEINSALISNVSEPGRFNHSSQSQWSWRDRANGKAFNQINQNDNNSHYDLNASEKLPNQQTTTAHSGHHYQLKNSSNSAQSKFTSVNPGMISPSINSRSSLDYSHPVKLDQADPVFNEPRTIRRNHIKSIRDSPSFSSLKPKLLDIRPLNACILINCDFKGRMCHYSQPNSSLLYGKWRIFTSKKRDEFHDGRKQKPSDVEENRKIVKGYAFVGQMHTTSRLRNYMNQNSLRRNNGTLIHVLESSYFDLDTTGELRFDIFSSKNNNTLDFRVCLNSMDSCLNDNSFATQNGTNVIVLPYSTHKIFFVAKLFDYINGWLAISNIHLISGAKCAQNINN